MNVSINVSIGEIIDKLSILEIKKEKIKDKEKLSFIEEEYQYLLSICETLDKDYKPYFNRLYKINTKLWNIENKIRKKESLKEFDDIFIQLARSVYYSNDQRFKVKNEINMLFDSSIKEQKSYQDYS